MVETGAGQTPLTTIMIDLGEGMETTKMTVGSTVDTKMVGMEGEGLETVTAVEVGTGQETEMIDVHDEKRTTTIVTTEDANLDRRDTLLRLVDRRTLDRDHPLT